MANPLWIPGTKSANPSGRPAGSIRNPKQMLLRFVNRNLSPQKLQKLYDHLSEKEKLAFLIELLPYCMAKQSSESLSEQEVEKLYSMIEDALKERNGKATG